MKTPSRTGIRAAAQPDRPLPQKALPLAAVHPSLSFRKAVFIYALGGLVGTLWETCWNLMRGRGFVYCNGSLLSPFNFVYGTGALVIILLLRNRREAWQVFLIGALDGGAVEYILSVLEELVLGTRSWDYSAYFLNIGGRTTLPYMLFWGVLCTAVIFIVYRPLDRMLDALPERALTAISAVLACWIALDMAVTVTALLRYAARARGAQAMTALGRAVDKIFGDAFMKKHFPAMRF